MTAPNAQLCDGTKAGVFGGGAIEDLSPGVNSTTVVTQPDIDAGRVWRVCAPGSGMYVQQGQPAELTANTGRMCYCPANEVMTLRAVLGESVKISATSAGDTTALTGFVSAAPFRRATEFGPLNADATTLDGYLTVAFGSTSALPVTFSGAKFTGSIAVNTLTVTAAPAGLLKVGMTLDGWNGTTQPLAPSTKITGILTGTGGVGTYSLSGAPQTVSSQAMYATAKPLSAGAIGKSVQLPTGAGGALTTYSIASVLGACTFTTNTSVTKQWSLQPCSISYGTEQSAALTAIHAAAYALGVRFVWIDSYQKIFAPNLAGCGDVIFVGDGTSSLVGAYQKKIIRFGSPSPGNVPRGCFSHHFAATLAAASPLWIGLGDSISTSADQFTYASYIDALIEQKLKREYPDKTITYKPYGIGGTSWRDLANPTTAPGGATTTFTAANGSFNIVVASAAGIAIGRSVAAAGYITAGTLVTNVVGTTITLSQPTLQVAAGIAVVFSLSLPSWYTNGSATWWSYVVALAPDGISLFFGMNSNNAADDLAALYTVLTNIAALAKVPDVIIFTPYKPSNVNAATNTQPLQELRDAHAAVVRGVALQKGVALCDLNEWFNQVRDGRSVRSVVLSQPLVGIDAGMAGGWAAFTPWTAPQWATDWFVNLQASISTIISTTVALTFGLGSAVTNKFELYKTAGGNYAVRIRLLDVVSPTITTTNGSATATVSSATGIVGGNVQSVLAATIPDGVTIASISGTTVTLSSGSGVTAGTATACTISLVPVALFDTGVAVLTSTMNVRFTVLGNWVECWVQQNVTSVATRLFGGFVPRVGGLMAPSISFSSGSNQNLVVYEYATSDETDAATYQTFPDAVDFELFGDAYNTSTGETQKYGGNINNHMATPGQQKVYSRMLASESWR